jgi:D-alanyl-lipoteichoic acid acyltransferase DltB (MBOAT superfamily)
MSATRTFALIYGIVFLLVGILGFVPALLMQPAGGHDHPSLRINAFEGYLLGLFHVNVLHSLVHVLFGVMGLAMSRRWDSARLYARIVAVSYLLLAILGLIPGFNTVFGLIPIHGHDVWLHLLLALPAFYFGFAGPRDRVGDVTTP